MTKSDRISLASAVREIQRSRPKAALVTVMRAIVGKAAAGAMSSYAATFWEEATPLEDGPCGGITLDHDSTQSLWPDFWTAGIVEWLSRENWETSEAESRTLLSDLELPYRFLKSRAAVGQIMELRQIALGIEFPIVGIIELIVSDDWKPWSRHLASNGKSGKRQEWEWDIVKAELTVAASSNPTLLNDLPSIVEFMLNAFEARPGKGGEVCPDLKDIRTYAKILFDANSVSYDDCPPPPN